MNSKELIITFIKTSCAVNDMLAQNLKPFGISLQQFNVLRILRGQNGVPANLSTVQELMVNKMSNTTRIIDKLIDKNFVARDICKENRRKIELFITKDGLSILKEIDPIVDLTEDKMVGHLSATDKEKFVSYMKQLKVN
ncbi:MarR family transcriptional regulator [Flavobacteriaceae bacterium]|jgi:DNA-binding MarR family transcriptional regulator|nr:MarR family transcriptional regulator [Flavobacteriaceae bacterium]